MSEHAHTPAVKPKPRDVSSAPASAPAPKISSPIFSADKMISGAGAPTLAGASTHTLLNVCSIYLNAAFEVLDHTLKSSLLALRELPPLPDIGYGDRLVGFLVEAVTCVGIGLVTGPLVSAAEIALGKLAASAVQGGLSNSLKHASQIVGAKFEKTMIPADRVYPAAESSEDSQKPLIDEFEQSQKLNLIVARAQALAAVELMVGDTQLDHDAVETLTNSLALDKAKSKALAEKFEQQIAIGWLNLSAAIALGPKKHTEDAEFAGANDLEGAAHAGIDGIKAWHGGSGFLEIDIDLPEEIDGVRNMTLLSARIPGQPGPTRILRGMKQNLSTIPLYRRITLVLPGGGPLMATTCVAITPEGNVEARWDAPVLCAIGRNVPISADGAWDDYSAGYRIAHSGQRALDATHAEQGARMLAQWISSLDTSAIQP